MESHLTSVIRCLPFIIIFLAWHVQAIIDTEVFPPGDPEGWNETGSANASFAFDPTLSKRQDECSYHKRGRDDVWSCGRGKLFLQIPSDLALNSTSDSMTLRIEETGIEILPDNSLSPYAKILRELYLTSVPEFHILEPRIFQRTAKLQTIYISNAPKLTKISNEVFDVYLPRLKEIRILRTGLLALPYLGKLRVNGILKTVDFDNNYIQSIDTAWIKIESEDLLLNYNKISSVHSMAFNGSKIAKLSLKGNIELKSIAEDAFVGLTNINILDLSNTSITKLPTKGLKTLEVLRIRNTTTLKEIPSIHNFQGITKANLTYPYHCCAFKFPAKHDPEMDRKYQELALKLKNNCSPPRTYGKIHEGVTIKPRKPRIVRYCGTIGKPNNVTCYPEPDAFNPCEDIMGDWWLRIAVWLVTILAIFGNLAVLIVLVFSRSDTTKTENHAVQKFLMCNLAFADLCMGIYLTLIASMDAISIGEYFNYAIDWQTGSGCKVAGFLTVFSTELSIFTLTIITGERWYAITYAIYLNRRLKLKTSIGIMAIGWVYSSIMAALPLCDISSYEKTSICLPLANRNDKDLAYLITLLIFNGIAFLVIVVCYLRMYLSIRSSCEKTKSTARTDIRAAKKMGLLVATDFLCWAPIAFFAITALAGLPLISVTHTKILLVFVYPLNSCANPYLYALLTRQYRRDLFTLLSDHGMCQKRAAKYRRGFKPTADQQLQTKNNNSSSRTDNRKSSARAITASTSLNCDIPRNNNDVIRLLNSKINDPETIVNNSKPQDSQESGLQMQAEENVNAAGTPHCEVEENVSRK